MDTPQSNERRFLYFYFNRNQPEKIGQAIPAHVQYWNTANLRCYMGGPFADRTGGLITFIVPNLEEAEEIVQQDPFVMEDLIDQMWIKEWIVE